MADEDRGALTDKLRGLSLKRAIGLSNCFGFLMNNAGSREVLEDSERLRQNWR